MTRLRTYIVMALTVALVALAGLAVPSAAEAAAPLTVHCESIGGGRFICDAFASVKPRGYIWRAGSNATITQNLGSSVLGTCTIGTTASMSVTAFYSAATTIPGAYRPPVTASTSFRCTSIAP
jgi:hypothetical protein